MTTGARRSGRAIRRYPRTGRERGFDVAHWNLTCKVCGGTFEWESGPKKGRRPVYCPTCMPRDATRNEKRRLSKRYADMGIRREPWERSESRERIKRKRQEKNRLAKRINVLLRGIEKRGRSQQRGHFSSEQPCGCGRDYATVELGSPGSMSDGTTCPHPRVRGGGL
jgi:hypothetical protein